MNIQQLEYIIAVDTYRHFAKAADTCFVTQPTLSMMIQKLEEELNLKLFDRKQKPIIPTREGEEIIKRAKIIIADIDRLKDFATECKGEISGELHLGIIPTLAPYLLPLFLTSFTKKFPALKIFIKEMITDDILTKLKSGELDMGLLATPTSDKQVTDYPLFYEEFYAYASKNEMLSKKKYLLPSEIDVTHLWLLEEGHCLRSQIYNLCELKKGTAGSENLQYEAGSIETLINLVDKYQGITIIPQLAVMNLKPQQKKNIREFANPKPVREISLVVTKNFARIKLLESFQQEIKSKIPLELKVKNKLVVEI